MPTTLTTDGQIKFEFPRALNQNDLPHESYIGWADFLSKCEVREEHKGTTLYGKVNCNYILLPNNIILQNFGYHGKNLFDKIVAQGWISVYEHIAAKHREFLKTLNE